MDHISQHLVFFLGFDTSKGFRCLDVLACLLQSGGQNIVQCIPGWKPHPGFILEIPCTGMVTCPEAKIWLGNGIV